MDGSWVASVRLPLRWASARCCSRAARQLWHHRTARAMLAPRAPPARAMLATRAPPRDRHLNSPQAAHHAQQHLRSSPQRSRRPWMAAHGLKSPATNSDNAPPPATFRQRRHHQRKRPRRAPRRQLAADRAQRATDTSDKAGSRSTDHQPTAPGSNPPPVPTTPALKPPRHQFRHAGLTPHHQFRQRRPRPAGRPTREPVRTP